MYVEASSVSGIMPQSLEQWLRAAWWAWDPTDVWDCQGSWDNARRWAAQQLVRAACRAWRGAARAVRLQRLAFRRPRPLAAQPLAAQLLLRAAFRSWRDAARLRLWLLPGEPVPEPEP